MLPIILRNARDCRDLFSAKSQGEKKKPEYVKVRVNLMLKGFAPNCG